MKKIILLLITAFALFSFNIEKTSDFSIVGKWKGVKGEKSAYYIFDKEGYAYIDANGLKIGGKEFEMKGKKASLTYKVDYTKSPMEVDIILTIFDNNKTKKLMGVFKKLSNDKILLSIGYNGKRPSKVKLNEDAGVFDRVKE